MGVCELFDLDVSSNAAEWSDEEVRVSRVVIIGRDLDEEALRVSFLDCFP